MSSPVILQDSAIISNTFGSWPVVDLEKSWNGKYLCYGCVFTEGSWRWDHTRNYYEEDKRCGFHVLDPVRWRIPCQEGLIAASPGWPTLFFITQKEDIVSSFFALKKRVTKPTRCEYESAYNVFIIRFWAEDYAACFRLMKPLKRTKKFDERRKLPLFCVSYPEKSLPNVGVPCRPTH